MMPQRYQIHAHRGFAPSVPTVGRLSGRECSRKNRQQFGQETRLYLPLGPSDLARVQGNVYRENDLAQFESAAANTSFSLANGRALEGNPAPLDADVVEQIATRLAKRTLSGGVRISVVKTEAELPDWSGQRRICRTWLAGQGLWWFRSIQSLRDPRGCLLGLSRVRQAPYCQRWWSVWLAPYPFHAIRSGDSSPTFCSPT